MTPHKLQSHNPPQNRLHSRSRIICNLKSSLKRAQPFFARYNIESLPALTWSDSEQKFASEGRTDLLRAERQAQRLSLYFPQVRANGLIIFVPKFGIEGPVYLSLKEDGSPAKGKDTDLILDEELQTLKSKEGDWSYTVSLVFSSMRHCVNIVSAEKLHSSEY